MAIAVYLKNSSGSVILGPISSTGATTSGMTWKLTALDGWYSMPISVQKYENPMGQKSHRPSRSHRMGRPYTLTGYVYGGTATNAVENAWDKLAALNYTGASMSLEVYDDNVAISKSAGVWLADTIEVHPLRNNAAMFVIPMWAPDPKKWAIGSQYRQTLTLPGGVTSVTGSFENLGSAPAHFIFTLNGFIDNTKFPINGTGFSGSTSIKLSDDTESDLTEGSSVTFTPDWGGVATLGATLSTRQFDLGNNGDWPYVAPFTTRSITLSTSGGSMSSAGSVVAEMYSVWY